MRYRRFLLVAIPVVALTGAACAPAGEEPEQLAEEQTADVREAISSANEQFMAAFNAGDAAGLAALYTTEGQLLPTGSDFITGTDAIESFWAGAFEMGIASATLETLEAEGMGDTAFEVGMYSLYGADGQVLDSGKYVVIWKQADGQWKLHRDIWNSNNPSPESEQ